MTSDNTTRFPVRRLGMHVCAASSTPERPTAAVLPKRTFGVSSWPEPDRLLRSLPHPELLRAVLDGLRLLDPDGGPR